MTESPILISKTTSFMSKNQVSESVSIDIPADVRYLDTVSVCLEALIDRMAVDTHTDDNKFSVRLAVHEVCTNIIEHAYHWEPGRIKIVITIFNSPKKIEVELFDQGSSALLDHVKQPNLEEPQVKGYGLYLIEHLVDELVYSRENDMNRWRLVKVF